jgi:hypothetical protein
MVPDKIPGAGGLIMEYLTVEFSLIKKGPLAFRFADGSKVEANHLQEFLNRQADLGWQLLAALPLSYIPFKTPEGDGLHLHCCRLIFRGPIWPNSDISDTEPPPGGTVPGRRLKPV